MYFVVLLALWLLSPWAYGLALHTSQWRVEVDPATLGMVAHPAGGAPWVLAAPGEPAAVGAVEDTPGEARWRHRDFEVHARLQGAELEVTFTATVPTELTWPRLPPSRRGLLLPLKEGHYIRADDRVWRQALTQEYARINTTEDLSLPAFGLEDGTHTLSWLFTTPFDNTLAFDVQPQGIGLALTHQFTALEPQRRYQVRIVLGEQDLLAPTKAWRAWLKQQGQFVPLAGKLAAVNAGERLIGASHLYLWGDGWPQALDALRQAGLPRLWLGLPQWAQGLAAPQAVAAAVQAGYLIGPYDSYDTALPPVNQRPTWLTAQLGEHAYRRCAIVGADGRRQPGFGGEGVYTNSRCVLPQLQARVTRLLAGAPFNSWFIDVAATGMLFNDFDPAKPTSQRQDAINRMASMAWVSQEKHLAVGSEVGGAVANTPAAFAHGMQTSGFGWGDAQMRQERRSRYYLGPWWPDEQPAVFFKPVALKAEYQALYFNPASRLPLFQAAYHDSLITTHHWTLDTLKFPAVRATSELLAQLYNVPPLLNLSAATAAKRVPYLAALDGFFRPLHQRLNDQALVDFRWLDAVGQVQQTRFADGTRLVANFGEQPSLEGVPPLSVVAYLPGGARLRFSSPGI
ncbi:glycoside hydrolase [Pseudomonas typographi]|uniref:Glycoside hydrolase n=1 Tax=Pseudomonas typographi TaxID=2715964 RepID=A0ABR7Z686_9PSED|nr:glycoside hydrolase [Pseudomonas typographi]MBD1554298.1 glycoside hydrolase [Pseudomonas typographi]MBD1600907.1 glycoside hydrolase [Pseudomonas typographi]